MDCGERVAAGRGAARAQPLGDPARLGVDHCGDALGLTPRRAALRPPAHRELGRGAVVDALAVAVHREEGAVLAATVENLPCGSLSMSYSS